jgi:hypothetical protein
MDDAKVMGYMQAASQWSSFAADMIRTHCRKGGLSARQMEAARSMAKILAAREAAAVKVDLTPIRVMFDRASTSGYKAPKYRAEGVEISKASAYGRNPGALYVRRLEDDRYMGKLVDDRYVGDQQAIVALNAIAADPKGAAVRFGQKTGTCSCCGRELTNHTSIELGIGPICREKWGL